MGIQTVLGGATHQFIKNNNFFFFASLSSKTEFTLKVTSVLTAPVMYAFYALKHLIQACQYLIESLAAALLSQDFNAMTLALDQAKEQFLDFGCKVAATCLSGLINVVDLIGCVINTVRAPPPKESTVSFQFEYDDIFDSSDQTDLGRYELS